VLTWAAPHARPAMQVPHDAMVRERPQRSVVVSAPQLAPRSEHSCPSVSGVQPHRFASAAPHVLPAGQVPQVTARDRPHVSTPETGPQFFPNRAQRAASLSQPHSPATPLPPQVWPPSQAQVGVRVTPQRSTRLTPGPQRREAAHRAASVSGMGPQVTVRGLAQLSSPTTTPHVFWSRPQKAESDSG